MIVRSPWSWMIPKSFSPVGLREPKATLTGVRPAQGRVFLLLCFSLPDSANTMKQSKSELPLRQFESDGQIQFAFGRAR